MYEMYREILHFYPLNELISNLMPATDLKKFGTGACLPWCSSSSFQNSLKMSETHYIISPYFSNLDYGGF